jgi:hypothetical protein
MNQPTPIAEDERITRYITEKGKIRPSTGKPGYNAYMPPTNLRLSVYRTEEMMDPEIWQVGDDFVSRPDRPVLARADLPARAYLSHQLAFDLDGRPHPRHANVAGWSAEHSLQKMIALQLAEASLLVYKPVA